MAYDEDAPWCEDHLEDSTKGAVPSTHLILNRPKVVAGCNSSWLQRHPWLRAAHGQKYDTCLIVEKTSWKSRKHRVFGLRRIEARPAR
jgi:hypothetical protein